jgi:hypothetical protein
MRRAFGIVCIVSVIYLASLIIGLYRYSINEQNELQQLILSYAIDYSSDGAMQEILKGDDLETDYSKDGNIIVDPKLALDTFVDMFCLNYDIGLTSEAKKHVLQNYIPVACLAVYDGYYIAKYQPVNNAVDYPENGLNNSIWDVVFGPKMPYTYLDAGTGTSYALNMGMEYASSVNGNDVVIRDVIPPSLNKNTGIAKINEILSSEIAYTVDSANALNPNWSHSFFIPAQLTSLSGANPITGPSLIVLVQNVDLNTVRPISGFSVSGTKIANARMIVGYHASNGKPYYCYADKVPGGVTIENLFSNVNDAAKEGYYCDLANMN